MKLYTEEQVREMMQDSFNFGDKAIDYAVSRMTPIELPSDEEIIKESEICWNDYTHEEGNSYRTTFMAGFINGATWIIEER